jgi:deoxyribodipyrimidine photo-lyase
VLNIVWFKRDLRVTDHAPLVRAVEAGMVLPLFVIEPELWAQPTHSARQWRFVSRALAALRTQLAVRGAPLVVRVGDAVEVLESFRCQSKQVVLWSHEETGDGWSRARNGRVAEWAEEHGVPWFELPGAGVVRDLTPDQDWAAAWDAQVSSPMEEEPEQMIAHGITPGKVISERLLYLDEDPCEEIPAGPNPAHQLLDSFLGARGANYSHEMVIPSKAYEVCSRLAPHLAWGTISTREAWHKAQAARTAEESPVFRKSIESFMSRLQWRCLFMQKFEDDPEIEDHCQIRAYEGLRDRDDPEARLATWLEGRTGVPIVDAAMRALQAKGWLNYRMRAVTASFAAHHLWLDWRDFGPGLARMFTDYEPGIHWTHCQIQSGVAGDAPLRIYDPVHQSVELDPDGTFIREWVPVLADVPTEKIHQPWTMTEAEQQAATCVIGRTYPAPMVEPQAALQQAEATLAAYRLKVGIVPGDRTGEGFGEVSEPPGAMAARATGS